MRPAEDASRDALRDLPSFLLAMKPYLDQVVLCGGWVPYLYRHLPDLGKPSHGPIRSNDFDIVTPPRLVSRAGGSLRERLLRGGFVGIRNREPPILFFQHERWGPKELAPVYGEFLTPLTGSDVDKKGQPKVLSDVQDGLPAQRLRYLDLLLFEPLSVHGSLVFGGELPPELEVRVPNPATYLLQKALALEKRDGDEQLKDLAYVFEVATLWFHHAERVRVMFRSVVSQSHEWSRWADRGSAVLLDAFGSEDADGPVSAETVFAATTDGHLVTASAVGDVTGSFLRTVLAPQ